MEPDLFKVCECTTADLNAVLNQEFGTASNYRPLTIGQAPQGDPSVKHGCWVIVGVRQAPLGAAMAPQGPPTPRVVAPDPEPDIPSVDEPFNPGTSGSGPVEGMSRGPAPSHGSGRPIREVLDDPNYDVLND
jgi:hypothetical protein